MRVLINTSNLKKGGALQVAHSFLNEIKDCKEHEFYVVLSHEISEQINIQEFSNSFIFFRYTIRPSVIKAIFGNDSFMDKLEKQIKPDCVFTLFGPSYWLPKLEKHIVGYAIPHYIYKESPFYLKISRKERIRISLLKLIHRVNLKRNKGLFWVETEDVKERFAKFLNVALNRVFVISNTVSDVFNKSDVHNLAFETTFRKLLDTNVFKFITITSAYPHKNLEIIKELIPLLKVKGIKCKFFLTLVEKDFSPFENYSDYIENLGPVSIELCPEIYNLSDALFLPTLLECFSASYPEAMKMGKPILTSDLSFAQDICGEAAEYFDPLDPDDILQKIEIIIESKERREKLVEAGYKRLGKYETAKSRAQKFLQICDYIFS